MTVFINPKNNPEFFQQVAEQLTSEPSKHHIIGHDKKNGFSFSKVKRITRQDLIRFEHGTKELQDHINKKCASRSKTTVKELNASFDTCVKVARISQEILDKSGHFFKKKSKKFEFSLEDLQTRQNAFESELKVKIATRVAALLKMKKFKMELTLSELLADKISQGFLVQGVQGVQLTAELIDAIKNETATDQELLDMMTLPDEMKSDEDACCSFVLSIKEMVKNSLDKQEVLDALPTVASLESLLQFIIMTTKDENLGLKLLDSGLSIHLLDTRGRTPLMGACKKEKLILAKRLIELGADIHAIDNKGNTALLYACREKEMEEIALMLIESKVNVHIVNRNGQTSLMAACLSENAKIALKLLELGVDVHAVDEDGDTALSLACDENIMEEVAFAILKQNPDVNTVNEDGETPLLLASKNMPKVALELVKRGANIHVKDEEGCSPFMIACKEEHVELALALLEQGAVVNEQDEEGFTPLLHACSIDPEDQEEEMHAKFIFKLLEKGAAADVTTSEGSTPLMIVIEKDCPKEIQETLVVKMIEKGGDVHAVADNGDTALIVACQNKCPKIIAKLLEMNVDVNAVDDKGLTAFHYACAAGLENEALELLKRGAFNINTIDDEGKTPFFCACDLELRELALELLKRGADVKTVTKDGLTPLHTCEKSFHDITLRLIDMGVDIHAVSKIGHTALFQALGKENSELSLHLIKKGADIHHVSIDGGTALMRACIAGLKDVALYLIDHNVNVHAVNKDKESAFQFACQVGLGEVIEVLLTKNVNVHFVDQEGNTALHYACQYGLAPFASHLLSKHSHEIDVTAKNAAALTPFKTFVVSPEWEKYTGWMRYFADKLLPGWDIEALRKGEIKEKLSRSGQKMSFEELAFTCQDTYLGREYASQVSEQQFETSIRAMKNKYPKSSAIEPFIFNVKYKIVESHLTALPETVIPEKPKGIKVRDILDIFKGINYYDKDQPDYFAPPQDADDSDNDSDSEEDDKQAALQKSLQTFVTRVERREAYKGTAKGGQALIDFYETIESATCHVIQKLKGLDDKEQAAAVIREFLLAASLCGPRIYNNAVAQFEKVVCNTQPTFATAILKAAQELRHLL
ncbi:MAG: repeat, subfamily, partial [Chlamydiia bacterium]|nr:repeat, subfamily [Chlamydiia bacterium]